MAYLGAECHCGSITDLEFDHIDPTAKLFDIADGIYRAGEVAFWQEVEKCQLLCRPHHRTKTMTDQSEGMSKPGRKPKLTPEQIAEATSLYRRGKGDYALLAQRYGVATSTIWAAIRKSLADNA